MNLSDKVEGASLLDVHDLSAGYEFLQVLWGVSLSVRTGEFVCLIGSNGAGKTTTLKTICGLITPKRGNIFLREKPIHGLTGDKITQMGISYISEALNLFTGMTVFENLAMGAYTVRDTKRVKARLGFVSELFPKLREREKQLAGTLSGGERKMLAIARGMMSEPSILLVDEPSLGLAPQLTSSVFKALDVLNKNGMSILLVEQNVTKTLHVTSRGYVLEKGRIVLEGGSSEMLKNDHVRTIYLGTGETLRKDQP